MTTNSRKATIAVASDGQPVADVYVFNQESVQELAWELETSKGNFDLIFAYCQYETLREFIVQWLSELCSVKIHELSLKRATQTLLDEIQAAVEATHPEALMVFGLDTVRDRHSLLTTTNRIREEFRNNFSFPLVLWINDEVLMQMIRLAPDFYSWGSIVEFVSVEVRLFDALDQGKERLFATILKAGGGQFISNSTLFGPGYKQQLDAALKELRHLGQALTPELEATLEFVLGREDYIRGEFEAALAHYQKSLD